MPGRPLRHLICRQQTWQSLKSHTRQPSSLACDCGDRACDFIETLDENRCIVVRVACTLDNLNMPEGIRACQTHRPSGRPQRIRCCSTKEFVARTTQPPISDKGTLGSREFRRFRSLQSPQLALTSHRNEQRSLVPRMICLVTTLEIHL